jgi:hypothetical protein
MSVVTFVEHFMVPKIDSCWGLLMVFNATFNNISAISWQSVLFVEETGVPGESQRLVIRN